MNSINTAYIADNNFCDVFYVDMTIDTICSVKSSLKIVSFARDSGAVRGGVGEAFILDDSTFSSKGPRLLQNGYVV